MCNFLFGSLIIETSRLSVFYCNSMLSDILGNDLECMRVITKHAQKTCVGL